jgi:phage protein U
VKLRTYSGSELSRLGDIIGQPAPRLVAHVSNGPWYGFNGIQALALTDQAVYRIQRGFAALRPDRVLGKYLLSEISEPRWKPKRSGRSGRISFRVAGSRCSYTSKWQEAAELAARLESLVSSREPT